MTASRSTAYRTRSVLPSFGRTSNNTSVPRSSRDRSWCGSESTNYAPSSAFGTFSPASRGRRALDWKFSRDPPSSGVPLEAKGARLEVLARSTIERRSPGSEGSSIGSSREIHHRAAFSWKRRALDWKFSRDPPSSGVLLEAKDARLEVLARSTDSGFSQDPSIERPSPLDRKS